MAAVTLADARKISGGISWACEVRQGNATQFHFAMRKRDAKAPCRFNGADPNIRRPDRSGYSKRGKAQRSGRWYARFVGESPLDNHIISKIGAASDIEITGQRYSGCTGNDLATRARQWGEGVQPDADDLHEGKVDGFTTVRPLHVEAARAEEFRSSCV